MAVHLLGLLATGAQNKRLPAHNSLMNPAGESLTRSFFEGPAPASEPYLPLKTGAKKGLFFEIRYFCIQLFKPKAFVFMDIEIQDY